MKIAAAAIVIGGRRCLWVESRPLLLSTDADRVAVLEVIVRAAEEKGRIMSVAQAVEFALCI